MSRLQTRRSMTPEDRRRVGVLLAAATDADGSEPLDDHLRLDLASGGQAGFVAVEALDADGRSVAYAQLSRGNDSWELGLVVDPAQRDRFVEHGTELIGAALAAARDDGGGRIHWWVLEPTPAVSTVADRTGLRVDRELHQMRRPLPTGLPVEVETRPFVVGQDEEEWLAVNNRAFAGHPEQGNWDLDTLRAREAEPWFDSEGFRLYEQDGQLVAFCWTKVHQDNQPVLGEIYVIAVDPDAHARGLGRALTLAGLDWLSSRGTEVGMLYVDASNTKAMGLYRSLGFTTHHVKNAYVIDA